MRDQFWHRNSLLNPTVSPPQSVWTQCRMGSSSLQQLATAGRETHRLMKESQHVFFPFSPHFSLSLSLSNFPGLRCLIFSGERWKPSRLPKASPGDVTSHHTRRLSHHSLRYTEALHNHVPQKSMNACRELFLTVIDKDA